MSLDILTPKGQRTVQQEAEMLSILKRNKPKCEYIHTPKDKPADLDGLIAYSGYVIGVFESKCRDMTYQQLVGPFRNEWLLTFDKLTKGALICRSLRVPMIGFLYLVPDQKVLAIQLLDKDGEITAPCRLERTETSKTINDKTPMVRTNAYIKMQEARLWE